MTRTYYVYLLASRSRALYSGVTSDLMRRVFEHRQHLVPGHTALYRIDRLVHFEATDDVHTAIAREKQLKGWRRDKKIALIESGNPKWVDLAAEWFAGPANSRSLTAFGTTG
ncbi:GIY-YIG nuclease family protein [Lysobacter fragariae]